MYQKRLTEETCMIRGVWGISVATYLRVLEARDHVSKETDTTDHYLSTNTYKRDHRIKRDLQKRPKDKRDMLILSVFERYIWCF